MNRGCLFHLSLLSFFFIPSFFYHLPRQLTQQLFRSFVALFQHGKLCALLSALAAFGGQLILQRLVLPVAAPLLVLGSVRCRLHPLDLSLK